MKVQELDNAGCSYAQLFDLAKELEAEIEQLKAAVLTERESCAKVCEDMAETRDGGWRTDWQIGIDDCVDTIRERGVTK